MDKDGKMQIRRRGVDGLVWIRTGEVVELFPTLKSTGK